MDDEGDVGLWDTTSGAVGGASSAQFDERFGQQLWSSQTGFVGTLFFEQLVRNPIQRLFHRSSGCADCGSAESNLNVCPLRFISPVTPVNFTTARLFAVPASGIVDYQNPTIKNPLTEGRWLRASTIKVGDRQAVHHLLSPVGGYAVGAESTVYPESTGSWVEPGQTLRFQMHYTPYGKATTEPISPRLAYPRRGFLSNL